MMEKNTLGKKYINANISVYVTFYKLMPTFKILFGAFNSIKLFLSRHFFYVFIHFWFCLSKQECDIRWIIVCLHIEQYCNTIGWLDLNFMTLRVFVIMGKCVPVNTFSSSSCRNDFEYFVRFCQMQSRKMTDVHLKSKWRLGSKRAPDICCGDSVSIKSWYIYTQEGTLSCFIYQRVIQEGSFFFFQRWKKRKHLYLGIRRDNVESVNSSQYNK